MQVASTLWPDIKSQKISERRFRLRWTKCSTRTNPNEVKTGQPQSGSDKEAQDSLPEEVSLLFLELYQLLQYSYDCSSVMSVHPEGGGSARHARVSLTSVD